MEMVGWLVGGVVRKKDLKKWEWRRGKKCRDMRGKRRRSR